MSDTNGRPIMTITPGDAAPFRIGGMPVVIAQQMPDVAAGSMPVAYGNWRQAYMVVNRKAVTMQLDPFSAGFCVLFKFEASAALFARMRRGCCASARALPPRGDEGTIARAHTTSHAPNVDSLI